MSRGGPWVGSRWPNSETLEEAGEDSDEEASDTLSRRAAARARVWRADDPSEASLSDWLELPSSSSLERELSLLLLLLPEEKGSRGE